jgi:hypothetical protein
MRRPGPVCGLSGRALLNSSNGVGERLASVGAQMRVERQAVLVVFGGVVVALDAGDGEDRETTPTSRSGRGGRRQLLGEGVEVPLGACLRSGCSSGRRRIVFAILLGAILALLAHVPGANEEGGGGTACRGATGPATALRRLRGLSRQPVPSRSA